MEKITLKEHGMDLKNYRIQLILFLLILSMTSCVKEEIFIDNVKDKFSKHLKEWNYKTKLFVEDKTLVIRFLSVKSSDKEAFKKYSYFLNKEDLDVLLATLLESDYDYYNDNSDKNFNIELRFDDFLDKFNYTINKKYLNKIHKEFEEFDYDMVIHTLKYVRYSGIIGLESDMKFLRNDAGVRFTERRFFELLKGYSAACKQPKDNLTSVLVMILLTELSVNEEYSNPVYKIKPEYIYYYLDHCGFKRELKNLTIEELLDYLDETYYQEPKLTGT